MNTRWWEAILFVTSITAYAAFMWILLAFARHAHRRILIMLDQNYYWKDAGVILRRESRKDSGPVPGAHRAPTSKRSRAKAEVLAIEDAPWPPGGADGVILGDPLTVPEADLLPERERTEPMGTRPEDLPTRTQPIMEVHHA